MRGQRLSDLERAKRAAERYNVRERERFPLFEPLFPELVRLGVARQRAPRHYLRLWIGVKEMSNTGRYTVAERILEKAAKQRPEYPEWREQLDRLIAKWPSYRDSLYRAGFWRQRLVEVGAHIPKTRREEA